MRNIIDYINYSKSKENVDAVVDSVCFLYGRDNGKTLLASAIHDLVNLPYFGIDNIKDVIFNDPATIVLWSDGTKTVVKCRDGETFDPEKGLALALAKKAMGNKYNYYEVFNKYVGKYNKKLNKKESFADTCNASNIGDFLSTASKVAQYKVLRDITLNTAKNLRAEGKSLAEIANIMGYDDPTVIRSILPDEENSDNEV